MAPVFIGAVVFMAGRVGSVAGSGRTVTVFFPGQNAAAEISDWSPCQIDPRVPSDLILREFRPFGGVPPMALVPGELRGPDFFLEPPGW